MKTLRILALSLFLLPAVTFARQAEMREDPVVEIPNSVSADRVQSVIKRCMKDRDWVIKEVTPGRVTGRYSRGKWWVKIAVVYNSKTATIRYVDSEDLSYEKDGETRYIHPNYNRWVANLAKDIDKRLVD